MKNKRTELTICVVGLGYVGLPLAAHFSKHYKTIGFDINKRRIEELRNNFDSNRDYLPSELKKSQVEYTADPHAIHNADIIIACVPTPVNQVNIPDLTFLKEVSKLIGKNLSKDSIVVFESTVYPGVTEEICAPLLEHESGLKLNKNFYIGYSPERINVGDKNHSFSKVKKIVSGSTREVTQKLSNIYAKVVTAGVYCAPSIKTAEAAKVIENIQRDINIALVNELAILFDRMDLDIFEVLKAAETKWNFHSYEPGLVGGHCIGVDPYYLTYKAKKLGLNPKIILAGRKMNDSMHEYYVKKVKEKLKKKKISVINARIGIFGLTFKANCKDTRNSRSLLLLKELENLGAHVIGIDPWLADNEFKKMGVISGNLDNIKKLKLDVAVITVAHEEFKKIDYSSIPIIIDIKNIVKTKPAKSF